MIDRSTIKKLSMFGLVGLSGMIIDYGVTAFLKEIIEANKYLANTTGFTFAATSNYFINRVWTFKSNSPKPIKEYTGFIAIAVVGLLLNNAIIWILSDFLFTLNFYLSKFIAISIVFLWNFVMNNYFNFKHRKH
jgi:putative flippase GtrA